MKPLPIAPATEEDEAIWWRVTRGTFPFDPVMCSALVNPDSDRRDAEQMFERMKWQAEGLEQGYDWRTERRGWFPSDWGRASDEYLNPL